MAWPAEQMCTAGERVLASKAWKGRRRDGPQATKVEARRHARLRTCKRGEAAATQPDYVPYLPAVAACASVSLLQTGSRQSVFRRKRKTKFAHIARITRQSVSSHVRRHSLQRERTEREGEAAC